MAAASAGYFWVPWEHIQHLAVSTPKNLRDLFWTPAELATFDGQLGQVYLPNLYPDTGSHPEDRVRLGHTTSGGTAERGSCGVRGPRSSSLATNHSPFRSSASSSSRRRRNQR